MSRPFFSLIIPCYNTGEKIRRIFNSLEMQNIGKDDIEIIVVDDNSTDLSYRDIVREYDFNCIFAETDVEIHCPGNTRREGMKYVTGEWLCFCDHDDYFESNALFNVKSYIQNLNHKAYIISTIMNGYDEDKHKYGTVFAHKSAWLHGKFYSMDNLIKPYNLNFRKDLVTHEDIYFNSSTLSVLFSIGQDWDYLDVSTYRWVDNPDSITRQKRDDRGYLYENFNDYIVSASEPFWDRAKKTGAYIYINQIMMTILHSYFYYEAVSYYEGPDDYRDIVEDIRQFIKKVMAEFNFEPNHIIDFVYADPYKYEKVLEDCCIYVGKFIPKTSFKDFVTRLAN